MVSVFEPPRPIGEDTYLHEPLAKTNTPGSLAPALAILCTWVGGATPRRINKYLAQYRQIYPSSALLLVTTSPCHLSDLGIVSAYQRRTLTTTGNITSSLFPCGGHMGVQLALSIKEEPDRGAIFFEHLQGIILDCCPGDDALERAYCAARLSVP
ncbi:hypothetical protein N7532_007979 [Penicillium argentinense]|uniref:Uncharacterized protein n=1 Tax=Penicillium argentinense TaxID=1131581 RepID=A0A9W9K1F3_9EURO|nr:uncharacterized protein N7532_007979 [Penicillium argentinense]KAJ5089295.1 hypothetical protein N7532_007979 [Penicillium argentinense]